MKPWSLFLAAALCGGTVAAQIKNTKLADLPAGTSLYQTAICVNADNNTNVVAAIGGSNIAYTLDGGQTWANSTLASTHPVYGDVTLQSDNKGTIYAFYVTDPATNPSLVVCQVSKDGGKTWLEESTLGGDPAKDQRRPWAQLDHKGNILLTWTQFDQYKNADVNCQSYVMLSRSSGGKKWDVPLQVSQTPGTCNDDQQTVRGPMAAASPDGKLFIAWSNQDKIFMDRSFNGGGLWLSNDIGIGNVQAKASIPGYTSMASEPRTVTDRGKSVFGGSIYLVWTDTRNGDDNADVLFMRSHNYGDNWSTPIQVNADTKGHQFMPWIAVDPSTGFLYVLYYDRHEYTDNQTDVYLAYSTNGGASFKTTKISETPFSPESLDYSVAYNTISAANGVIAAVWTRADQGNVTVMTTVLKQADFVQVPPAPAKGSKKK